MILNDRVTIRTGGGRDRFGDPLPYVDSGPFPAVVSPIRSSEAVQRGTPPLTAFYRLIIGSTGGNTLTSTGRVKWRGREFAIQGDVEPWVVNGRIHHYEATMKGN